MNRLSRIPVALLLAAAVLFAACSDADPSETTSAATTGTEAEQQSESTTTTTTEAPPEGDTTTTTSPPLVIAGPDVPSDVVEQLSLEIAELIVATEEVRGLDFLSQPTVTILSPEELEARVRADIEEELDPAEIDIETRLAQLFGLLGPGDDLGELLLDLYGEQVAGFYDPETEELVIGGDVRELSTYTKTIVVHELIHALTDQHFLFNEDYEAMYEEERFEEAAAFQALIEGDATYFQIVYLQSLPFNEQLAMATEVMELLEQSATPNVPSWLLTDLSFPYDSGQTFVTALVDDGGIAAVDQAYVDRPQSTEVIMHPERYAGGERVRVVDPVSIEIDGYEVYATSSYGEWGLRLLLGETAAAGVAARAANGWGGDSYQVLSDSDDVVFALAYKGDSEDDAFELADALIVMVTESLEMGEPVAQGGGVVFNAEDGRYAYLDRIGDGFIFVLSTDAAAGAAAVDQMNVP